LVDKMGRRGDTETRGRRTLRVSPSPCLRVVRIDRWTRNSGTIWEVIYSQFLRGAARITVPVEMRSQPSRLPDTVNRGATDTQLCGQGANCPARTIGRLFRCCFFQDQIGQFFLLRCPAAVDQRFSLFEAFESIFQEPAPPSTHRMGICIQFFGNLIVG